MNLTNEEEKTYKGEYGPLQEWAMKFLTKYGDAYDTEKLASFLSLHSNGFHRLRYARLRRN